MTSCNGGNNTTAPCLIQITLQTRKNSKLCHTCPRWKLHILRDTRSYQQSEKQEVARHRWPPWGGPEERRSSTSPRTAPAQSLHMGCRRGAAAVEERANYIHLQEERGQTYLWQQQMNFSSFSGRKSTSKVTSWETEQKHSWQSLSGITMRVSTWAWHSRHGVCGAAASGEMPGAE